MINVQHIKKSFGRLAVLQKVSFELNSGQIYSVLGPNGSGKTTLLKIMLGMVIPDGGKIQYLKKDILSDWKYRNTIGYLPQIARFPDNLTVRELILMITDVRKEPANPEPLLQLFKLEQYLDARLGTLSGGTRQKVNIVLTFMFDCPLLILDEPTAGLDPVSVIKLKDLLRTKRTEGKTIIITSHIMSMIEELTNEVIFLLDGEIKFQGSIPRLSELTGHKNFEKSIASILRS